VGTRLVGKPEAQSLLGGHRCRWKGSNKWTGINKGPVRSYCKDGNVLLSFVKYCNLLNHLY
jgi:hypothetical protein